MPPETPRAVPNGRRASARAARLSRLGALAALALVGCVTERVITYTPRTATEQLLVAESAERAVDGLALPGIAERRVAVELAATGRGAEFHDDLPYLREALEGRLRQRGARVVATDAAERILAVRVGALGTTGTRSSLGIPSIPLLVGATPEIEFYRHEKQHGYTKLRVSQRAADGSAISADESAMGRARFRFWKLLFVTVTRAEDVYPAGLEP